MERDPGGYAGWSIAIGCAGTAPQKSAEIGNGTDGGLVAVDGSGLGPPSDDGPGIVSVSMPSGAAGVIPLALAVVDHRADRVDLAASVSLDQGATWKPAHLRPAERQLNHGQPGDRLAVGERQRRDLDRELGFRARHRFPHAALGLVAACAVGCVGRRHARADRDAGDRQLARRRKPRRSLRDQLRRVGCREHRDRKATSAGGGASGSRQPGSRGHRRSPGRHRSRRSRRRRDRARLRLGWRRPAHGAAHRRPGSFRSALRRRSLGTARRPARPRRRRTEPAGHQSKGDRVERRDRVRVVLSRRQLDPQQPEPCR